MSLTKDKVEQLPEVYRDFLLTLAPVVESRRNSELIVRINGVPFSRVYSVLNRLHDFDLPQVRQLAFNLKEKGYIEEDKWGFLSPTALGEHAIALMVPTIGEPVVVPPLPDLN